MLGTKNISKFGHYNSGGIRIQMQCKIQQHDIHHRKESECGAYLRKMLCSQAPMRCCRHSPAPAVVWTGTTSTACFTSPWESA